MLVKWLFGWTKRGDKWINNIWDYQNCLKLTDYYEGIKKRTKHIEIKYFFIKQEVMRKEN